MKVNAVKKQGKLILIEGKLTVTIRLTIVCIFSRLTMANWLCGELTLYPLHGVYVSSWFPGVPGYIELGRKAGNQPVDTIDTVSDAIK